MNKARLSGCKVKGVSGGHNGVSKVKDCPSEKIGQMAKSSQLSLWYSTVHITPLHQAFNARKVIEGF